MARKKDGGPEWDDLTEDQKIRLDKVFTIFANARARRLAKEAKS